MRPVPKRQHRLAVLILAAVSAICSFVAMGDYRLGDTQLCIGASAIAAHDASAYKYDTLFGHAVAGQFNAGAVRVMSVILAPTGYRDVILPFRMLAGVMALIYLLGMYALIFRQCGSWTISTLVAVISSTIVYTLGDSYWGVGPLASITPWTLCNCLAPWIVLGFLHYIDRWQMLVPVFAAAGLIGNIHPVVSMNLTIVLLIVYMGRLKFSPQALLRASLFGMVAVVATMPYMAFLLSIRTDVPANLSLGTLQRAFHAADWAVLYPDVLRNMLNWILLIVVVLLIPAAAVLSRVERFRVRNMREWLWFMGAALTVCLVFHGASQLAGYLLGSAPPVIDFVQAASLLMLPLYVLLAQAFTNISRLVRTHPVLLWLGCFALMAAWMVPSDNCRMLRYFVLDKATMFMPETDKPRNVQRHHEADERYGELKAIAQYAQTSTGKDAVFVTDKTEFRMLSQRALAAGPGDVRYLYYFSPDRFEDWLKRLETQKSLLRHPAAPAIARFVAGLKQADFRGAKEWYVILEAGDAPDNPAPLTPVTDPAWGRHYCLYKVP